MIWFVVFIPVAAISVILISVLAHKIKMALISHLRYNREFSDGDAVEGDVIYITETVYNPTLLPIFKLDIASYIDGNLQIEGHSKGNGMQLIISRFYLFPFSKVTRRHKVICLKRGHYKMESAAILHKKKTLEYEKTFKIDSDIYVYPKTSDYPVPSEAINFAQGADRSRNRYIKDPFSIIGIKTLAMS